MFPLLILIGVGVAVYAVTKNKTRSMVMRRGGAYKVTVHPTFNGDQSTLESMGFASVIRWAGQDITDNVFAFQAIWTGKDGETFHPPAGMDTPVFLGMVAGTYQRRH